MRKARRDRLMRHIECPYVHRNGHAVTLAWMGVWSEAEQRHFYIGRDATELKTIEAQKGWRQSASCQAA